MAELSRDELRAHLSAVEAQVHSAMRVVAAESKSRQQAQSALRADLSAALIRLQADINGNANRLESKVEIMLAITRGLGRQRRLASLIVATLVLLFGLLIGLLAGGGWYIVKQGIPATSISIPLNMPVQDTGADTQPAG